MYSSNSFKFECYKSIVAFLHCFTGCDTVSGFAGKGKKTTIDLLLKAENLLDLIKPFYEPNADYRIIARNGCSLIASIYNAKDITSSLDDLRFQRYKLLTAKSTFQLEKLPPTVGAATQHSYRSYCQLQKWLGNEITASKWGWKEVIIDNSKMLVPRFTDISLIPEDLLKKISCHCTTNCSTNRCGCRKHGLKCTVLCTKCEHTEKCSNTETISEDDSDSEDNINGSEQPGISLDDENQEIKEFSDSEDIADNEEEEMESSDESELDDAAPSIRKRPRLK